MPAIALNGLTEATWHCCSAWSFQSWYRHWHTCSCRKLAANQNIHNPHMHNLFTLSQLCRLSTAFSYWSNVSGHAEHNSIVGTNSTADCTALSQLTASQVTNSTNATAMTKPARQFEPLQQQRTCSLITYCNQILLLALFEGLSLVVSFLLWTCQQCVYMETLVCEIGTQFCHQGHVLVCMLRPSGCLSKDFLCFTPSIVFGLGTEVVVLARYPICTAVEVHAVCASTCTCLPEGMLDSCLTPWCQMFVNLICSKSQLLWY